MTAFPNQGPPRRRQATPSFALCLDSLESALDLLQPYFCRQSQEHVRALFLDGRGALCGMAAWMGKRDLVDLPVRRIITSALAADATALILAHNHPSGDPNPSAVDVRTTRNLARICAALDIRLLDHIILSDEKITSMRVLRLI